jgi:transposase
VRVRDLPTAGRVMRLPWRKCHYRCRECERTFTENYEQLPTRQRVTRRFRAPLAERIVVPCRAAAMSLEMPGSRGAARSSDPSGRSSIDVFRS